MGKKLRKHNQQDWARIRKTEWFKKIVEEFLILFPSCSSINNKFKDQSSLDLNNFPQSSLFFSLSTLMPAALYSISSYLSSWYQSPSGKPWYFLMLYCFLYLSILVLQNIVLVFNWFHPPWIIVLAGLKMTKKKNDKHIRGWPFSHLPDLAVSSLTFPMDVVITNGINRLWWGFFHFQRVDQSPYNRIVITSDYAYILFCMHTTRVLKWSLFQWEVCPSLTKQLIAFLVRHTGFLLDCDLYGFFLENFDRGRASAQR